ncbi:tripartite motif-containing protein 3-like isoform X2 [Dermacentor albipictus]|uniref:tripartite motif-containing protein 3-like isoform X2 n=1 Tax=Dermacentor albipictus TaxID=60249 RepID=UPI0031FC9FB5
MRFGKGRLFGRRTPAPGTPVAARRHARAAAKANAPNTRIPQPKLVHFPSKMEVRTAPATPTCSPAMPLVSDYRSHFNSPSTSGGGPASSASPSLPPVAGNYQGSHHSPSNGTSSSASTESIPTNSHAAAAPANLLSHSPQNGFHSSTATLNGSVNGHSVGSYPPADATNGSSPHVNGNSGGGGDAAQRQASITILSSKGTESLKEMVQCPICLDRLHRPKMLPCQHTFCFLCLQNSVMSADASRLRCAKCRSEVPLPKEGISGFPSSIHLQNILDLLESDYASMDELLQCCGCQTVSGSSVFCEHCKLSYCSLCMARHVEELAKQLGHIADQLDATVDKIALRYKKFESSQSDIQSKVRLEAEKRVRKIRDSEAHLLLRVETARAAEETGLQDVVQKVRAAATGARLFSSKGFDAAQDPNEKILAFMKLHRDAGDALSEVTAVGNTQVSFDPEAFSVTIECRTDAVAEDDAESPGSPSSSPETTPYSASSPANALSSPGPPAADAPNQSKAELQRVAADAQSRLYRSKSFLARMRLGNGLVQRPSGAAVSPWSSEIFVVSMDNHKVLTFDSTTGRFLRSFGSRGQQEGEFLCPFGIALSPVDQEILITDKWKHCIHVFDRDGNFLRQIGMKGRSAGHFRSPESICVDNAGRIYVCDTCNHRIQVLDHDGIFLREIGTHAQPENAFNRSRSMFQEPTGVAVSADGQRVVVCDFGSHRVHVFSSGGEHLHTFGQKGALKGHFMHPECVAVDGRGFILVGDSGNGRVQICRPDGRHVRTFGNKGSSSGQFSWISGIAVTAQNEVVVCDFKNHSVQVF